MMKEHTEVKRSRGLRIAIVLLKGLGYAQATEILI